MRRYITSARGHELSGCVHAHTLIIIMPGLNVLVFSNTVGSHLSEHVGTRGCSDNRNVRIIELLIKNF